MSGVSAEILTETLALGMGPAKSRSNTGRSGQVRTAALNTSMASVHRAA